MKVRQEKLGGKASVKGTMLQSRVSWIGKNITQGMAGIEPHLDGESFALLNRLLVRGTEWIPFCRLIQIDRAIAAAVGGPPESVYHELGRHSASLNLGSVYKLFISTEPHESFQRMALLHNRFQNFGRLAYNKVGHRSGRITMQDYYEYSPVYCASALGYYEEALRIMKAPGPIVVTETSCQCAGEDMCLFELKW